MNKKYLVVVVVVVVLISGLLDSELLMNVAASENGGTE